jgi:predicted MPP superfamily phosphohydrolase
MARIRFMLVFLTLFGAILGFSHFYLWARLSEYLQLGVTGQLGLAWFLGGMALLTLLSLPVSRMLPRAGASVLGWVVYPWMGIALLLLMVVIATDTIWLISQIVPGLSAHNPARMQRLLGVTALVVTAILSCFALWQGLRGVTVKPVTIKLDKLPKSLDGLRIAQLTDLHIGPLIGGDWLRRVVAQVNALKPDLIVITGDLVDGSVDELRQHVAPLSGLVAPYGVYFITGNHEYYSGVEEWCAHIASLGVRVLRNERVSITAGTQGQSFDLAGVDDWHSSSFPGQGADLAKALAGRDTGKALILLAHQPAAVDEAAANGVDLQLSGHTHGGQIWPFTYLVYLQQPYAKGLHRHRNTATQIYISSGTGFWGPPMRFGTIAEITHITLRSVN